MPRWRRRLLRRHRRGLASLPCPPRPKPAVAAPRGLVGLHLACNDERGRFDGYLYGVELHDQAGGGVLELDGPWIGVSIRWDEHAFAVRGMQPVSTYGRRRWIGNMGWDATSVTELDARRLARFLVRRCEFSVSLCDLCGETPSFLGQLADELAQLEARHG